MSTAQSPYYEQVIEELDEFPREHLPALLEMMRLFRKSLAVKSSTESFRQAWQEAMNGETLPITEMWTGIDVD